MKKSLPLVLLLATLLRAGADPVADVASFSIFKDIDLSKLGKGDILASHGPVMSYPEGLSVQFCYVLPVPLANAVALQKGFDGSKHPELKVYLHAPISSKPSAQDFAKLDSAPGNASVKSLAAATEKLDPAHPQLQMSAAEAKLFGKTPAQGGGGALPPAVRAFWGNLLLQRASAFASGGVAAQPPYFDSTRASVAASTLLKEQPKIRSRFAALADRLNSGSGSSLYWELFDVEGQANFALGAVDFHPNGESWQGMDVSYYASGGYYVYVSFFEFWPVKIGDQSETLVWRGDMLASAELAGLHGVERVGSAGAMKKSVQKTVDAFVKSAKH